LLKLGSIVDTLNTIVKFILYIRDGIEKNGSLIKGIVYQVNEAFSFINKKNTGRSASNSRKGRSNW
jgi:hypothetical protein